MIRALLGDKTYWDSRVDKLETAYRTASMSLNEPVKNPGYEPQYWFDQCQYLFRIMLLRYSRGDAIHELSSYFSGLLEAWELSNRLASELNKQLKPGERWDHRHLLAAPLVSADIRAHNDPRAWVFDLKNLNHYNWCFWLIGLALTLDIPDDQWNRLVVLIDAEGQDELLDRVMATQQKGRVVGKKVLHPKPYARLLSAIDAPPDQRPGRLREFVDNWYPELAREGKDELWWYIYGDPVKHPLTMGSYFGRWCLEAAVVAKVFGIDDVLCLGHEYYPGDLLRPDGPTTHPRRQESKPSFWKMVFGGKH